MRATAPAKRFLPIFKRRVYATAGLVSLLSGSSIGLIEYFRYESSLTNPWLYINMLIATLLTFIAMAIVLNIALKPLTMLTAAILNITNQPTELTPPNPNDPQLAKLALTPIIQSLYEHSTYHNTSIPGADPHISQLEKLQEALQHTSVGFLGISAQDEILYANAAAPVFTNSDGVQKIDVATHDIKAITDWLNECRNSEVRAEMHWQRIANRQLGNQDRRTFDVHASYERGNDIELVLTFVDRTSTYDIEDEQLDFVAFAAHELRGPITVIRGYLDVLRQNIGDENEEYKQLLSRLVISSNRLSSTVNNILNASRYDRQHMKLRLVEHDLRKIYNTIGEDLDLYANALNRHITVRFADNIPTVAADKTSLSEVFSNLVENAIKYSPDGGEITVAAVLDGDYVRVSVADQGIGIPQNVIDNLFRKFYRSHRSRDSVAGTGIGLHICKMVVESHGGAISVQSVEGKGSTFVFTIPAYKTVAKILAANDNSNTELIPQGDTTIHNHTLYKG